MKSVLITGSSRGIGRAAALSFARKGYRIIINGFSHPGALQSLKEELETLHVPVLSFCGDIGNYAFCQSMIDQILHAWGSVDVLVNNAGISHIGLFQDMTPEEWNHILQTNLTSVYNCCSLLLPSMIRRQSGSIINISSVWGNVGASCEVAYSATKGAINSLTKALAKETAPSGVRVNAIACGAIDTEMNHFLNEEDRQALIDEIPAGRLGSPDEIGDLICSLAEGPDYLTGQIITCDGAWI